MPRLLSRDRLATTVKIMSLLVVCGAVVWSLLWPYLELSNDYVASGNLRAFCSDIDRFCEAQSRLRGYKPSDSLTHQLELSRADVLSYDSPAGSWRMRVLAEAGRDIDEPEVAGLLSEIKPDQPWNSSANQAVVDRVLKVAFTKPVLAIVQRRNPGSWYARPSHGGMLICWKRGTPQLLEPGDLEVDDEALLFYVRNKAYSLLELRGSYLIAFDGSVYFIPEEASETDIARILREPSYGSVLHRR